MNVTREPWISRTAPDFWATPRQLEQLESLTRRLHPADVARVLRQFAGGTKLDDVSRFLTRREAASLILLLSVVASPEPLVA